MSDPVTDPWSVRLARTSSHANTTTLTVAAADSGMPDILREGDFSWFQFGSLEVTASDKWR